MPVVVRLAGVSTRTVALNFRVPAGPAAVTVTVRGTTAAPARPPMVNISSPVRPFLGNLPQGLSHLSMISAATAIAEESG